MLDLSTENKDLCFEDSTKKPLYIFLYYRQASDGGESGGYWRYFTTIENAIVLESAEITEGALEGNNFELGSFVAPSMKVQWENTGIRYKDMVAVPVQKIGDEYIAYFDGYISNEGTSEDGQTVTAEITSFLTERLDIDVSEILKGWDNGGTYEATFDDTVYNALAQVAGIVIKDVSLLNKFRNASQIIHFNQSTFPNTLTAKELLKQAGEFLGAHIVVKEKRVVDIDDMTTYEPFGTPIIDFIRFSNVDTVAQSNIKPLPSGYKRLEYIQSNGTQYIDTNFVPSKNPRIVMTAKITSDDNIDLFGSGNNITPTWRLNIAANQETGDANFYYRYYSADRVVVPYNRSTLLNKKCIYDIGKSIVINGTNYYTFDENYDFSTFTKSIKIFGSNEGYEASVVLYDCKIYNGDTLVRDFLPALNSNGVSGLYDFVENKFYTSEASSQFIAPNAIETYTLPYYINLYADKTNRVNFDQIRVVTKTGDMLNYQMWWKDNVKTTYEIKNNIFFEALSTQNWKYCSNAVREVGSYLENQNLYYADLQTVYPPFIEGGDYLIIKSKNQGLLPSEYSVLESADISNSANTSVKAFVDSGIILDSDNIEIDLEFELLGGNSTILVVDGSLYNSGSGFLLSASGNVLLCQIYNADSANPNAFRIPFVPLNQKIHLNLKFGNGKYQYSGTFSGNGEYDGSDVIYTKVESLLLGSGYYSAFSNYRLHRFALSQGGVKQCDMYPCLRERDSAVGMYDITQNAFKLIQGNPSPNYEIADIVVPALSTTARGIHSMRADILCKATNSNKN